MSFDSRNEIETRFVTNIDEQSFDEVDKRLKDTAENASKAEQAIVSVQPPAPIPFDVLPGGGGGSGRAGKRGGRGGRGLGQANKGLRQLSGAASLLGDDAASAAGQISIMGGQAIGLVDTVAQLGSGMGAAGAAAGVLILAMGVLAADTLKETAEASREMAKAVQKQTDAERALLDAKGQTSDEIESELALIDEQIDGERELRDATKGRADALNEAIDKTGLLGDAILLAGSTFGNLDEPLKTANKNYEDQAKIVSDLEIQHAALTEALDSEEVAANDATQALLDQVDQIEETRKFEQDALDSSSEQNANRAESIANASAIIQEQLELLAGNESEEATQKIEELNAELVQLGQQSDILNSSAVKAAEAQRTLADAEKELEAAAEKSAKEVERAASKTASARQKERKVISEANAAAAKAKTEELEAVVEQEETLAEFRADAHDAQIDAEKDFNKSIDDLVENQSFLAAIDKQDDFVDEEQSRRDEARESLIALQMDLAEERIEKEIAAQEDRADRQMAIAEAAAVRASAERDEIKLRRDAANDTLKLQRNRGAQELDLQSEINKNLVEMLTSVVDFSGEAANRVDRILSQSNASVSNGGKRGKRGKNNLESVLSGIMR